MLFFSSCARFRIEELKPSVIFSYAMVPPGEENPSMGLQPSLRNRVLYDLPLKPALSGSRAYLPDPEQGLIRVLSTGSGELQAILSSRQISPPAEVKLIKIPPGIPGWICTSGTGELYIQIFSPGEQEIEAWRLQVPPENRLPGELNQEDMTPRPSLIYHLNPGGEVLESIGVEGRDGNPFGLVERMDCSEKGGLAVLHRENKTRSLSLYRTGSPPITYGGEISLATDEEKKKYLTELDNLVPIPDGTGALASVSFRYRGNYEPAYRKIFRLSSKKETPPAEILTIENPSDYFAWVRPDGGFYLLNSEGDGSRILFKIYSPDGEYINNRLVRFPGIRAGWRETYLTPAGEIRTTRIHRGRFELYEWK